MRDSDPSDEGCRFRVNLNPFTFNYARLVMISQGIQQSLENGSSLEPNSVLLTMALHAATTVIRTFLEKVAASGIVRYAPDCYFVYVGYAATFLLKLIDPRASSTAPLDQDQTDRIIALVSALVHTLGSNEIAIDENHTPKLYARFLSGLLNRISQHYYSPPPSTTSANNSPLLSDASFHVSTSTDSFMSWDDLYNFPPDGAQDIGASWNFGNDETTTQSTWDINAMCPSVIYLDANAPQAYGTY